MERREACDLIFLAMAHHRLGHADHRTVSTARPAGCKTTRDPYERGRPTSRPLSATAKAASSPPSAPRPRLLAAPRDDLPGDVFADPR